MTAGSDEWSITHDVLPGKLTTHILETANRKKIPDHFVVRGDVIGIKVTYERTVRRNENGDILLYLYALYTSDWVIEARHDPNGLNIKTKTDFVWNGRGNERRWLEDATLFKLALSQ